MCHWSNKQSIRLMYNLFMRHCAVYSCFNAHPIRASVYSICVDQYTRLACFNKQCTCRSRACESLGSGWQVDASKSAVIVLSLVMKVDGNFTQFWNDCFRFQKGSFKFMFIACDVFLKFLKGCFKLMFLTSVTFFNAWEYMKEGNTLLSYICSIL